MGGRTPLGIGGVLAATAISLSNTAGGAEFGAGSLQGTEIRSAMERDARCQVRDGGGEGCRLNRSRGLGRQETGDLWACER